MRIDLRDAAIALCTTLLFACGGIGRLHAQTEKSGSDVARGPLAVQQAPQSSVRPGPCWLLKPNADSAGPGTWLRVQSSGGCDSLGAAGNPMGSAMHEGKTLARPVIRSGEQLTIEDDSIQVEARLQGVALESAPAGFLLTVRLQATGRVVRVFAISRGRARFTDQTGDLRAW